MGVMLARLGRYCDCFEEVEEYDIEVSKIRRLHKFKREPTANNSEGISESDIKVDQREATIANMQKLRPAKAAAPAKSPNPGNAKLDSSLGNILDSSYDANNSGLVEDENAKPSKENLLKHKLQRIRERRREREKQEDVGIKRDRSHILNISDNKELFMDKEEIEEFDGNRYD